MIVRKVRGQNKIGKIIIHRYEAEVARKLKIPLDVYVKQALRLIAKKRKWTWYLKGNSI